MRARALGAIDPSERWDKAAGKVIRMRLEELLGLAPHALASGDAHALHDLRIAATRLRYLLELTDACYGESAQSAARLARELQELAGAIHDHDLLLERIATYTASYTGERAQELALAAGVQEAPVPLTGRAERATCAALGVLAIECKAQRAALLAQLRARFDENGRARLQHELLAALGAQQRPGRKGA
jgi:hypothetical protein